MPETTVERKQDQTPEVASTREESRHLVPPVDIYETEEGLVLMADLPGVARDSIDIRVDNDVLTIEARPDYSIRGDVVAEEFSLLNFYRQFILSDSVDPENISAEYKNGVLTLHLPKAERAKARKIEVKTV